MLAFCACGHTRDEHIAGCTHINAASKRFPLAARCTCARFTLNEQMQDAEVFLAKHLHSVEHKVGRLEQADRDDLLQVMRIALWKTSAKYDSRSHIRFGSYASFEVYNDAIDEIRSSRMFGRHGQHRLQPLVVQGDDDSWFVDPVDPLDQRDSGAGRLERVVSEFTVDAPDAGDIALRWALAEDDRAVVGAAGERRGATTDGAANGDRDAAWASGLTALTSTEEEAA